MKLIMLVSALAITSCASVKVSDGARKVRVVTESPQGCEYLGEVAGEARGSIDGGLIGMDDEALFTRVDLKNKTAELGGDTVQVMTQSARFIRGEAYRCARMPASQ